MSRKEQYIVYVGSIPSGVLENVVRYIKTKKRPWKVMLWRATDLDFPIPEETKYFRVEHVDFSDPEDIKDIIAEYEGQIACVTARKDTNIPYLQKTIPHLPEGLRLPMVAALERGVDKIKMRKAFSKYSQKITPKYEIIDDLQNAKPSQFKTKLHFPVIVKPDGLQAALLVQAAYYPEELKEILTKMQKTIGKIYKRDAGRGTISVLIEEIIEGDQYSVDVHIGNSGTIYFNPFVKYTMARQMGYDDFFSYEQTTPATISKESLEKARQVCADGIAALKLRNSSAHIELIRREGEWKIVEIGPRIGGFRPEMYGRSFGINIDMNDVLIRMGKKPIIPRVKKGYSSAIKFYPREEGYVTRIAGIQKAKELKSFESMSVLRNRGKKSLHAKHGGRYVVRVTLFNKDKSQFIKDKRKLEKMIKITTVKQKPSV